MSTLRNRKAAVDDSPDAMVYPEVPKRRPSVPPPTPNVTYYAPSFSVAFKLLLAARLIAAILSNISDCDEVFNFWEPTHYLQHGMGLQTWEYSPVYAIRSWTYASLHAGILETIQLLVAKNKLQSFYFCRGVLGAVSAYSEATLYRAVVDEINPRIGRCFLIISIFSTGMFNASTAYLPSTFAMYTTTLAAAFSLATPSRFNTYAVVLSVAAGAIVGWPFSGAVGIPFVIKSLLFTERPLARLRHMIEAGLLALIVIGLPLMAIDHIFYEKWTFVPCNIVMYNVFSGLAKGPNIYGTEPWWFYIMNGILNFNIVFVAALLSFVALAISEVVKKVLGAAGTSHVNPTKRLMLELSPMFLMFAVFSAQPHKEERFLFVVYPLICLAAAVTVYQVRAWIELTLSMNRKLKPYSQQVGAAIVVLFLTISTLLSLSRTTALYTQYHAPLRVYAHTHHLPLPGHDASTNTNTTHLGLFDRELNLCVGKEWYRFPSHYFLPEGMRLRFVKSSFDGLLPKYFEEEEWEGRRAEEVLREGDVKGYVRALRSARRTTSRIPNGMNDENREDPDVYWSIDNCDYMVDFTPKEPLRFRADSKDSNELNYALDERNWEKHYCEPFLDAAKSGRMARAFWVPGGKGKVWGEYCLLRRRGASV
ncbi:mannosyltransferase [Rhizophlyctis rosea]|uniref:Mannosyltransferase n=1 Tax=Rhizophlyctis rosea TaxID=64517 RepID=A0AAD5X3I2_9FUNG|nr:mannosyltransferase [Rhizophlyctis rosea]